MPLPSLYFFILLCVVLTSQVVNGFKDFCSHILRSIRACSVKIYKDITIVDVILGSLLHFSA